MQVQYTVQDLEAKKVTELRKIAREHGIKHIDRDGTDISVSTGRKNELMEVLKSLIIPAPSTEVTEVVKQPVEQSAKEESEYQKVADEQAEIAKLFYEGKMVDGEWAVVGLKEIFIRNVQSQNPLTTLDELTSLIVLLRPTIERHVLNRADELRASTVLNWKAQVLNKLKELIKSAHVGNETLEKELQSLYQRFESAVKKTFSSATMEKRTTGNKQLQCRQDDAVEINVSQMVEWAKDLVTNLPEKKSNWNKVAVAVMILTGRRQSEVMATGKFEVTDSDSHLIFSGQLKRHNDEVVAPFEIPVLGRAANGVVEAIKWLENHGKRENDPKAAHDRFSRYLSYAAKFACGYITSPATDWSLHIDSTGKKRDRRKCHLFRQIYGQVVIPVFFERIEGRGKKAKRVLSKVMGHSDNVNSRDYAAEAYDADVFVMDAEKLR